MAWTRLHSTRAHTSLEGMACTRASVPSRPAPSTAPRSIRPVACAIHTHSRLRVKLVCMCMTCARDTLTPPPRANVASQPLETAPTARHRATAPHPRRPLHARRRAKPPRRLCAPPTHSWTAHNPCPLSVKHVLPAALPAAPPSLSSPPQTQNTSSLPTTPHEEGGKTGARQLAPHMPLRERVAMGRARAPRLPLSQPRPPFLPTPPPISPVSPSLLKLSLFKRKTNAPYTFPRSCMKRNGSKLTSQWKCTSGSMRQHQRRTAGGGGGRKI
ncbi:hypothetical protein C8F04DRAFT_1263262 [Mycena alexandri]|uniref:Uncharacterized protein n=1 Tax=Mycena alexandri TaxID=1745969 RepID=A0AAD6SNZ6_9AGAR|nr:hypothetical protein C8F04DRAFT_1263262 [Mycena alexandri]